MQGDDPRYYASSPLPNTSRCIAVLRARATPPIVTVSNSTTSWTPILPAFRGRRYEGKAGSVMCAYNSINGQPACANQSCCKINCAANGASRATVFDFAFLKYPCLRLQIGPIMRALHLGAKRCIVVHARSRCRRPGLRGFVRWPVHNVSETAPQSEHT